MQSSGIECFDGRKRPRSGGAPGLVIAVVLLTVVGIASAADHPALVNPEQTTCTTCHDEILAVRAPHAPAVEDCLACHSFDRSGDQTTVGLAATGAALCLACHDDFTRAAEGELAVPHAPVVDDCSACHDAHGTEFDLLLVTAPEGICLECHDAVATDAAHPIPVSRADCRSCHQAHGSDNDHMLRGTSQHAPFEEGSCEACHRKPRGTRVRLLQEGGALCAACHGNMAETIDGGTVHTALLQGRCVECHDPHLAEMPTLLRAGGGELCFSCHPDIAERAAGPGAHPALEDGCDGCHDPHRSDQPWLLLDDEDDLCLTCHDPADPELRRLHFGAEMTTTRCASCHDPHGSTSMPLIANGSIHAPFREGCSDCHEGTAGSLVDGGNALCETCHDDVAETIATAAVPHPAMEMVECVDCHSPHASRQPKLLRAPGGDLCLTCHEDQAAGEGETTHGAITWIGCQSCHLPHGGAEKNLLRASGNDLCSGCHLQGRVKVGGNGAISLAGGFVLRGDRARSLRVISLDPFERKNHPIPDHPVSGVVEKKGRTEVAESLVGQEMSCRLCHEPHAAPSPKLYTWQAKTQSELCIACHPK